MEHGDAEAGLAAAALSAPRRPLPLYLDVMEICSGFGAPFTKACAALGLVVAPPVDIRRHAYLDILRDDFFVWL